MPAHKIPETPPISIACSICGTEMKPISVKPSTGHRHELVSAGREISQVYLDLASECFNKAATAEQANGAEALRQMGRRYVGQAEALDRSRGAAVGVL